MSQELKPCPLCDSDAHIIPFAVGVRSRFSVKCEHCGCSTPSMSNEDDAVDLWNRRPLLEEAERALDWALSKIGRPTRLIRGQNDGHVASYEHARAALSKIRGE